LLSIATDTIIFKHYNLINHFMFDKVKDLYKLQKQAKEVKKKLGNLHIEAEIEGVKVTINGEQEVILVEINDNAPIDKKRLGEAITKCFNKAIKKSQQIAADEMKDVMGGMGLGGLLNGNK